MTNFSLRFNLIGTEVGLCEGLVPIVSTLSQSLESICFIPCVESCIALLLYQFNLLVLQTGTALTAVYYK